jgi:glycosyltransferase involved in cell wall biosynthesis
MKERRVACVISSHDLRNSKSADNNQPATIIDKVIQNDNWDVFRVDKSMDSPATTVFYKALEVARNVFHSSRVYDAVFIGAEDVGLPVAVYGAKYSPAIPVNILTMGALFWWRNRFQLIRSLRNANFLCISESIRQQLLSKCHVLPSLMTNVGYAVDTEFFCPMSVPKSSMRPMVVSAGAEHRDYEGLMAATAGLEIDLRIAAGSAWRLEKLEEDQQACTGNTVVRSYKDRAELRKLYAEAAFIVVPLRPVPSGSGNTVVAEAMSMGKAVILTYTEGRGDFLLDGETGFWVSAGNPADLRHKIISLLDNPALAREMGERARRLMEDKFHLGAVHNRIMSAMKYSQDWEIDVKLYGG